MGNRVSSRGKARIKEGRKEDEAKTFRKFTGCTERRMDIRKIYQKGSLSVSPLLEVHWLGRTEVPAKYYHKSLTGNVQEFLVFVISNTLIQTPQIPSWVHSIPTHRFLVNTTCGNAGSRRRRIAAGTRRANPIQQLSWVFHLIPVLQSVVDSLKPFCPMLCLVIIFQNRFSKILPLMEVMRGQNIPTDSCICSLLLFISN